MSKEDQLRLCTGFQWDAGIADKNWERHRVSRGESEQVFFNRPLVVADDLEHVDDEERYYALGRTSRRQLLFVVFTIRGELIRVIDAANPRLCRGDSQRFDRARR